MGQARMGISQQAKAKTAVDLCHQSIA